MDETSAQIATFNILEVSWEAFGGAKKRLDELVKLYDPIHLVTYLEKSGWIHHPNPKTPGGMLLSYGDNKEYIVFVPTDKGFVDYEMHMMEALKTLVGIIPIFGHEKLEDDDFLR